MRCPTSRTCPVSVIIMTRRESTSYSASPFPVFLRSVALTPHSHEELYHNTEDTQTDESYTHPEDIKHFQNHAKIEAEEEALALKAQGLPADPEVEKARGATPAEVAAAALHQDAPGQVVFEAEEEARQARSSAAKAQADRYRAAAAEAKKRGPWSNDFKRPKDKADKLRVGVPCVDLPMLAVAEYPDPVYRAKYRVKRGSFLCALAHPLNLIRLTSCTVATSDPTETKMYTSREGGRGIACIVRIHLYRASCA